MKICGCIVFSDLYRQKEDCSSALLNKLHIWKYPQFYILCCTVLRNSCYTTRILLYSLCFAFSWSDFLSMSNRTYFMCANIVLSATMQFFQEKVISEVLKKVVLDVSLIKPWKISHVWDAILDITAGHITRSLEDFVGALIFDTNHAVAEQSFTCEILYRHI